MEKNFTTPVYTIGVISRLLKVCPATLRIWEKKGLIKPRRVGKNRFYSRCDLERLEYIKALIQKKGINIQGVKGILTTTRCWELKKCKSQDRETCPVYLRYGQA